MRLFFSLLGLAALEVAAVPFHPSIHTYINKRKDNTQAVGANPITKFSTEYLGLQQANNSASHRDLGFTGQLGGKWYALYGDTLWAAPGVRHALMDTPGFHGMVRDSLSECTDNPLVVKDLHLNEGERQTQFIPYNEAWGETNLYGFGGTSLCETDNATATGVMYYLVNANDTLVGAGAAKVELVNGTPTVTQRYGQTGWWWDANTTAPYGDIAAFRDPKSDYIYLWGNPPQTITDWLNSQYVYLARVNASDAFDLSKYEYYWGQQQGWKSEVLDQFNASTAVMWNSGQGQMVWNEYLQAYVMVHLGPGSADVYLRTATALEGPWTPDVKIYTSTPIDGGLVYAGVAHPYLDESGKTLTVSWTNNNNIEVAKVSFG